MKLSRAPGPALRPFVELLWAWDAADETRAPSGRELVSPTGAMHVVLRLGDRPLRVFADAADTTGRTLGFSLVGGARARPFLRDVSAPAPSVGAMLRPGAAGLLLGAPAAAFSNVHTPLDDVWAPAGVAELRERLEATPSLERRLELFEAALAARRPQLRGLHPLVAHALARLDGAAGVGEAARDWGCSHRHLTAVFREAVGLTPKAYQRVRRFGRALDRLAGAPDIAWTDLAFAEGYADQPHFTREFRAFAGVSPGRYRRLAPASPHHVPL